MKRIALVLLALMPIAAGAKEPCKIEHWKQSDAANGAFFYIEGTSTCRTGAIYIHVYEGDRFFGIASGHIQGFTFRLIMRGPPPADRNSAVVLRYAIDPP